MQPERKPAQRSRIGFRTEANIFLPTATLGLIVLSIFTILSYRASLHSLTESARSDVMARARAAASVLSLDALTSSTLLRVVGSDVAAALVEPDGTLSARAGEPPLHNPFAPFTEAPLSARTAGPSRVTGNRVVAWLPLRNGLTLRVERPAPALAREWARWRRLSLVVALAVLALATLLVLYLRRLFGPIDNLLRTARALDPDRAPDAGDEDDIAFLLRRFENAMHGLEAAREEAAAAHLGHEIRTLEQTFSHLESGLMLLDLDGLVIALNHVGASILDIEEPLDLPRPLDDLLASHQQLAHLLGTAIADNAPLRRHECTLTAAARPQILGLTLSPLTREDGTSRGWIVLYADLTDALHAAEEQRLSASLDQLAELSAGLAHELRNSLASLQGFTALLRRAELAEPARADVDELHREIGQLHRIVEDFLSFARPGTTRMTSVDLLRLAHRVAGDPALGGAAVRVREQFPVLEPSGYRPNNLVEVDEPDMAPEPAEPIVVRGDEQLLHRLLRNLLLNAVRAQSQVDPKESVLISIERGSVDRAQGAVLHVLDRGPGLSREASATLFVPFATQSEGGSGLGLAIARRIADLHGAHLELANRPEGGVEATLHFSPPNLGGET